VSKERGGKGTCAAEQTIPRFTGAGKGKSSGNWRRKSTCRGAKSSEVEMQHIRPRQKPRSVISLTKGLLPRRSSLLGLRMERGRKDRGRKETRMVVSEEQEWARQASRRKPQKPTETPGGAEFLIHVKSGGPTRKRKLLRVLRTKAELWR